MAFNKFRINIAMRLIFGGGSVTLLVLNFEKNWVIILFWTLVVLIQGYYFIRYLNRTHRDMINLFEAIRYDDFSFTFSRHENDRELDNLYEAFNKVLHTFRQARMRSEEYRHFLQTVVHHVGIPLIAFNSSGEIEIINTAAKKFLKITRLTNLSELKGDFLTLEKLLISLRNGEKKNFKVVTKNEVTVLSVYATAFVIQGKSIKLVTLVNISRELDEKELESWLTLLKVLTHEIMNSMTPISSLSTSVRHVLGEDIPAEEKIIQADQGLETIERRSLGMVNFISSFRSLTTLPRPEFTQIVLTTLFEEIRAMVHTEIELKQIHFYAHVEPITLQITADSQLMVQVLTNLVKNSIDATEKQPTSTISILGFMNPEGQTVIVIEDNGTGILPEVQEKIFIPFFTTKKNGSGIGLSLSKLIMQAHHGLIRLESEPGVKTRFSLIF